MAVLTVPYSGVGITLSYRVASSGAYTALGQVNDDLEFDGWENAIIPVKYLNSKYTTKIPGRQDFGNLNGTLYNIVADTSVQEMYTLFFAQTTCYWQLQFPDDIATPADGSTFNFQGFVTTLPPNGMTGEDVSKLPFSIAISGALTQTIVT